MKFYEIPENLAAELDEFENDLSNFLAGQSDPVTFKAIRVSHGVYQERNDRACMLRIRCAAGGITPDQLKRVAELSDIYGNGKIHFTTRQEMQIHSLELTDVVEVLRELHKIGLTGRGGGGNTVRNILSPADSGIAVDEVFDVEPYTIELTNRLIAEPDSWNLPRKFKIVFCNRNDSSAFPEATCLGFAAVRQQGIDGFKIYAAGGLGAKPMVGKVLLDFVPAVKAYQVTRALKTIYDKYGNRRNRHINRIKFLWQKLGREEFVRLFQQEYDLIKDNDNLDLQISPIINTGRQADLQAASVNGFSFQQWYGRYVRSQKQKDLVSVVIPLKLGELQAGDAILLGDFLKQFGDNTLRCSREQNILLRNIPAACLGNVYRTIREIDSLAEAPAVAGNMISCNGAEACKPGICKSGGLASELHKTFIKSDIPVEAVADFRINISGCPNSCGMHQLADLGFAGKVGRKNGKPYPAYRVFAGFQADAEEKTEYGRSLGDIGARYIPDFVRGVFKEYIPKKEQYNNFASYWAVEGDEHIAELLEKYGDIPDYEDQPEFYYDFGSSEPFSLKDIGKEECSAGMFDLISVDVKLLRKARTMISATEEEKIQEVLYFILFAARDDQEVFELFRNNFIRTGLVARGFEELVLLGKDGPSAQLIKQKDEVLHLADTVLYLYDSLDDSLRFQVEREQGPVTAVTDTVIHEDLRGVACPMNFVKTKLLLAKMQPGSRLSILLDDGQPIENVPYSVAREGHKIIEKSAQGNSWSVLIEKH
jgi:sulfite reductase (ferredoxin)